MRKLIHPDVDYCGELLDAVVEYRRSGRAVRQRGYPPLPEDATVG
jgi:hypothetical protein